ncbi:ROK family transcriptional regulator [Pseudokineococcus basanitobsidens]|uniref:ROK family transcriptional regulator n=1 Tax=Pseudokineococcus basanitobsidens TaxID=1926649 RepID=A0ABU8RLX8_9ACTN
MARRALAPDTPGSRALIVDLVRSAGPISRVELTQATGLTQAAVSMIVRKLLDDDVVVEVGSAPSSGGKPRRLLDMNRSARYGLGIQLGAESMTVVATDTSGGVVARERHGGAGDDEPAAVVAWMAEVFRRFVATAEIPRRSIGGVAVVVPGPIAADGLVGAPTLTRWSGFGLREELERRVELPVLVDNDANAAALGEFWGRGVSRYTAFGCVYIGAGIGAGVVVDGALYRGASSNAAELGHISVDRDGPPCFCGGTGCLERLASPAAVVEEARRSPQDFAGLGLEDPGRTPPEVYELLSRAAVAGHGPAEEVITRAARLVASATLTFCTLFDLDEVVLSGPALATAGSIYAREVRGTLEQRGFARRTHETAVSLSTHPRDAAAVGAAALTLQGALSPGHGPALSFTSGYLAGP